MSIIKKQGLKILSCGSGIESQDKQKRSKALPLGESPPKPIPSALLWVGSSQNLTFGYD